MAFCNQCGATLNDGARFCASCGADQNAQAAQQAAQPNSAQPQQNYTPPQQPTYTQPQQPAYTQPGYGQQPYPPQGGEYGPVMTTKQWLVMFLLLLIPIAQLVLPFVWAFGEGNPNRRNYWRAALIFALIMFGLMILLFILLGTTMASMFGAMRNNFWY